MKKTILCLLILGLTTGGTAADDMIVTVYNSNLGVVSENRSMSFEKGTAELKVIDVPTHIDATSVRFELIDNNRGISILEQNYAYDLISPDKMYRRYIDEKIELIDKEGKLYHGKLLSVSSGSATLIDDDGKVKIILMNNITEVNFPALPEGLITRPTLLWKYISNFNGQANGNLTYQTSGLSWSAEYVGVLNENEDKLNLSGWGSITNNSGKTYPDATLKLVAGDINRASAPMAKNRGGRIELAAMEMDQYSGFEEKSFFEYHMYTLPRKATIANNEVKQIALFEPANPGVKKTFMYRPDRNQKKIEVVLKSTNSKQNDLGIPLPAGRVRIFKADTDGALVLLGEDRLDHTPKDEDIKLNVGFAFDITAEQRLMDQKRISKKVEEQTFEIDINNRKDSPVTVEIEKMFYGDWEITVADFTYKKKDAFTITFPAQVAANETNTYKFTVRFTY